MVKKRYEEKRFRVLVRKIGEEKRAVRKREEDIGEGCRASKERGGKGWSREDK